MERVCKLSYPCGAQDRTRRIELPVLLFNIFYEELIGKLHEQDCGISIKGNNYNVFCYADDILLASTTPSGLQTLIDVAVAEISKTGLRFNALKTSCLMFGKCLLISIPV